MTEMKPNKTTKLRKLIDLDREVVKKLQLQSINNDFGSVKEYIENVLTEIANKKSK